jgi:hypothetical protein
VPARKLGHCRKAGLFLAGGIDFMFQATIVQALNSFYPIRPGF